MANSISRAWERFREGFALTSSEIIESNQAARHNLQNDEAIKEGYSASSRVYQYPEIPDLIDRLRRGFQNVISDDCDRTQSQKTVGSKGLMADR